MGYIVGGIEGILPFIAKKLTKKEIEKLKLQVV